MVAYSVANTGNRCSPGRRRSWPSNRQAQQAAELRRRVRATAGAAGSGGRFDRHAVLCVEAARRGFPVRAAGAARPPVHRPSIASITHRTRPRSARRWVSTFPRASLFRRASCCPASESRTSTGPVRQPDFRRSRPLPRLPRNWHRPHRAAQVRSASLRLAKFESLTGLPGTGATMRQTLDEALRNAAIRQGPHALHDRPRPLQDVNDTLGHPSAMPCCGRLRTGSVGDGQSTARSAGSAATSSRRCCRRTVGIGLPIPRPDADRAGVAPLSGRGAQGDDWRVRRNRHRRRRACERRRAGPQCRLALYAAKAAGRGKHRFYEAAMHSAGEPTAS